MRRWLAALPLVLLLAGCAYYSGYNGIHSAGRLADDARRSTREGRPGQAQDYWSRAAVKAESLLVRQPDGKWSVDARLIRGEALGALGRCSEAVVMLRQARAQVPPGRKREQAAYALGRCEIRLGQPALAAETLTEAIGSGDEALRRDALAMRGRALLTAGEDSLALAALTDAGLSSYSIEVLAAQAGTGNEPAVLAGIDSIAGQADSLFPWDSLFHTVGGRNAVVASHALDHARAVKALAPGRVPSLLLADAARLPDSARRVRLAEAVALAPKSEPGDGARFQLLQESVARTAAVEELAPLADSLTAVVGAGMGSAHAAGALLRQVNFVRQSDTLTAGAPEGDLRLFLAAETARDSLGAHALAGALFRRLVEGWPDGAYAPKALLAARQLDPGLAASTDSLLQGRYAESPYVIAARGGDRTSFLALEDSLARYTIGLSADGAPAAPGARAPTARPQTRPGQEDGAQPRRNRPPPRGGRRVEAEP